MDPEIAAQFKRLQEALEATNQRLEEKITAQEEKISAQEEKITAQEEKISAQEEKITAQETKITDQQEEIQLLKAFKASLETSTTQLQPILRFSKRWRFLMLAGGLLAPGLAVKALMERSKDPFTAEKLSWASYSFVAFSGTCLVAAVLGNVRRIGSRVEKSVLILIGLLLGVTYFFPGYALASYEDEDTAAMGKLFMSSGALWAIIGPPIVHKGASKWSALEDHELSSALIAMFKALPGTLASQVYLSTAAMRCVLAADDESPLYEQCGNPLIPTFQINMLLFMAWFLAYVCAPLMKDRKTKTWGDVMVLKMGKMEGFQFSLGSILGTVAWVEFATLNEGGELMTDFMQTLITLFILFFYSLCALVLFDIFVRPRLCPSSATTTSAENDNDNDNDAISLSHSTASTTTISASVSSANNGDSPFNMQQVTVSSFGSS
mmetsp:Transcript_14638/g.29845  ORF Transcript_14638/g.29845 Transcript_14638/m.29845 type:complete len:437 (+) Transcript_14638:157-1467(+)